MKKTFSLMMFALLAVGANAATAPTWSAPTTAPTAETALVDNDLVKVATVFATKVSGSSQTFGGYSFSYYMQVRVNDDLLLILLQEQPIPITIM